MEYNKLVRDKIPQIIVDKGKTPTIHIASQEEYLEKLDDKLLEEAKEFLESHNVEELADILEVIRTICKTKDISMEELEAIRLQKAKNRGAFSEKIILEKTD